MSPPLLPFTSYPTSTLGHCLSPLMSQSLSYFWIFLVQYYLLSIQSHEWAYMTFISSAWVWRRNCYQSKLVTAGLGSDSESSTRVVSHSKLKLTWRDPIFSVALARFWPLSQLSRTSSPSRPRSHALSAMVPSSHSCLNWSLSLRDRSLSLP